MNETDNNEEADSREKRRKKEKKRKKKKSKYRERNTKQDILNVLSVPIAPQILAAANTKDVSSTKSRETSKSPWSWKSVFDAAANVPQEVLDEEFLNRTSQDNVSNGDNIFPISQLAKDFNNSKIKIANILGHNDQALKNFPKKITSDDAPESLVQEAKHSKKRKKNSDKKKRKKKKSDSTKTTLSIPDTELDYQDSFERNNPKTGATLEGKMVDLPSRSKDQRETIMVLINREKGLVFSAFHHNDDGSQRIIGKIKPKQDDEEIQFDPQFLLQGKKCSETEEIIVDNSFPYPTDTDDHCESPVNAYEDIIPLLDKISKINCVSKEKLAIYDPYYCNGSIIKNLASLGFPNVYNQKEDCYLKWASGTSPKHDVFITNPPYSEDHIPKLLIHLTNDQTMIGKPWFLLMPSWVHKKDYYNQALKKIKNRPIQPFYVVPKKRYVYVPPKKFRQKKKSDVHTKSSPFVSMWYIWGGDHMKNELLIQTFLNHNQTTCELARSKSGLRDLRRKSGRNK